MRQFSRRAVFGAAYGMEVVNYFAPEGEPLYETPSFRRSNAFAAVGAECRAVRTAVGINEIHNFGKYEVTGPDAEPWLNRIMANRMPAEGRVVLSPMFSPKGRLIGDFTVAKLGPERFQLTASYAAQAYHMRWFLDHLPDSGVRLENVSLARIGFQIAGPKARELLQRVTRADVSNAAVPFLAVREIEVGLVPADQVRQRRADAGQRDPVGQLEPQHDVRLVPGVRRQLVIPQPDVALAPAQVGVVDAGQPSLQTARPRCNLMIVCGAEAPGK